MRLLKKILPLIGIALFLYLIIRIGVKDILDKILQANLFYIILSFLFLIPIVLFQALKWHVLMRKQKIGIRFYDTVKLQLISMFYGSITPARVGSFIKIAYLQEKVKNFGKSASSVVIDRFFDMLTVLIFASIGSIIVASKLPNILFVISGVFLLFILFFGLLISKNRGQKIMRFIYEKLAPEGIKKKTRRGFNEFYKSIPKKRNLVIPFLLNIASWMTIYTQLFIVAKAINIEIDYYIIIFMFPIATIISEIPASIGGLGIREASLITLLGFFGIPANSVMSMSIISLIITNLLPSLLGVVLALRGYKLKNRKRK